MNPHDRKRYIKRRNEGYYYNDAEDFKDDSDYQGSGIDREAYEIEKYIEKAVDCEVGFIDGVEEDWRDEGVVKLAEEVVRKKQVCEYDAYVDRTQRYYMEMRHLAEEPEYYFAEYTAQYIVDYAVDKWKFNDAYRLINDLLDDYAGTLDRDCYDNQIEIFDKLKNAQPTEKALRNLIANYRGKNESFKVRQKKEIDEDYEDYVDDKIEALTEEINDIVRSTITIISEYFNKDTWMLYALAKCTNAALEDLTNHNLYEIESLEQLYRDLGAGCYGSKFGGRVYSDVLSIAMGEAISDINPNVYDYILGDLMSVKYGREVVNAAEALLCSDEWFNDEPSESFWENLGNIYNTAKEGKLSKAEMLDFLRNYKII